MYTPLNRYFFYTHHTTWAKPEYRRELVFTVGVNRELGGDDDIVSFLAVSLDLHLTARSWRLQRRVSKIAEVELVKFNFVSYNKRDVIQKVNINHS